jgi:hypothetical protein
MTNDDGRKPEGGSAKAGAGAPSGVPRRAGPRRPSRAIFEARRAQPIVDNGHYHLPKRERNRPKWTVAGLTLLRARSLKWCSRVFIERLRLSSTE